MKTPYNPWIYRLPRVLTICFLCFLALFSLDVFDSNGSFGNIVLGLLIHNIPVLFLAIVLWVAREHEIVGAITFFVASVLYMSIYVRQAILQGFERYMLSYSLIIGLPALVIAVLFFLGWRKRK